MKSRIVGSGGRIVGRVATLAAAAAAVEGLTASGSGRSADRRLFRMMNEGHGRTADLVFGGLTELGSIAASGAAAGVVAAAGRPRTAFRAFGAAGATWVLGQALKKVTARDRPYDADPKSVRLMIGKPAGTSWPSSHPAVLMAFVTVAGRELGLGTASRGALAALAGVVGLSRVYLGVHYPSDVAAGLLLGRAVGLCWLATGGGAIQ